MTHSRIAHTQTLCVPEEPGDTHHFGFSDQNLEYPILGAPSLARKMLYKSHPFPRSSRFCSYTFFLTLTVSFFPGRMRDVSSSLKNCSTASIVSVGKPVRGFLSEVDNTPLLAAASLAFLMLYSEVSKNSATFFLLHDEGVKVNICCFSALLSVISY